MKNTFRPLVHIHFLHHYFLDEGEQVYGDDLSQERMDATFAAYNVADYLSITPTKLTAKKLAGRKAKAMQAKDGLQILMKTDPADYDKPFIPFEDAPFFDFVIRIKDRFFENYTDITIDRSKLVFISNKAPATSTKPDAINTSYYKLSDYGGTAVDKNILFGDDFDASEISGAYALLRLHFKGDSGELKLITANGKKFVNTLPEQNIVFVNRKTKWKYLASKDSAELHTTNQLFPLTKNGYIKVKKQGVTYPNPDASMIVYNDQEDIYYSEVFI